LNNALSATRIRGASKEKHSENTKKQKIFLDKSRARNHEDLFGRNGFKRASVGFSGHSNCRLMLKWNTFRKFSVQEYDRYHPGTKESIGYILKPE
jgi:hypothetical protein